MYEGLINNLNKAADKWEKEHPIIGVGQLRVHDALRDAARALKEADSKLEQVTLERDAAVRELEVVAEKAEQVDAYIDDYIHANVDYSTYLDARNMVDSIVNWEYESEWHGVQKEDGNDQ